MKHLLQYIFIFLIIIMLYLTYLVGSYKYTEYKVLQYIDSLTDTNKEFLNKIQEAKFSLEYKNTKAYRNKILKSEWWRKNKWEEVLYLIQEDIYNKYTNDTPGENTEQNTTGDLLTEQSLISTMTIYQKWIYLIFDKDIR